jgi:hypothetical protein
MKHDQISRIAYRFWQERGCPDGSPEVDWMRAEAEVVSTSLVESGLDESESLGEVPTLESEVVLRGELTPAKSHRRRRQDSVL